jgi:gluconate 5-dehydrogenase
LLSVFLQHLSFHILYLFAEIKSPDIASKHGVIGLTRQGAVEHAENGIRVNAMAPSWHSGTSLARARQDIQTTDEQGQREKRLLSLTPMKRRGRLDEIPD